MDDRLIDDWQSQNISHEISLTKWLTDASDEIFHEIPVPVSTADKQGDIINDEIPIIKYVTFLLSIPDNKNIKWQSSLWIKCSSY